MSLATAKRLGAKNEDLVAITAAGATLAGARVDPSRPA